MGPGNGDSRVLRGGSWYNYERNLRSSNRYRNYPDYSYYNYGFRCLRSP